MPYRPLPFSQENVVYEFGPDSAPGAVKPGIVEELTLDNSVIFPGTTRKVWLHRPAEHLATQNSAVMFFNDGWWYLNPEGDVRGGIVLDNLAAAHAIPPIIGVFVDPGMTDVDGKPTKHRNAEYDAFDDSYAGFLLEEILPLVQARYAISPDPSTRGICGGSSGGNAALTAAWRRPDSISRVITYNSSFTQMPGGNPYPKLLAFQPRKNLRVFLQAAHRDQGWNSPEHNWFAEALETAAALARAGYDFRLVVGDGPHSANHGGTLLPDAMRWLWRP
jgi:enterochelin esterase-like enzyme